MSVFKTFTIAAGFNEKLIEPKDMFNNLEKKIKCGGRTISEYDGNLSQNLSVEEILVTLLSSAVPALPGQTKTSVTDSS